jgi:adenosylmethionine-8-amino-7-oxononanoate aminotransferase
MDNTFRNSNLIWHPLAQKTDMPITICRGHGAYVFDEKDNPYLDLISSWWVNLHGHCNPEIALKIYEQALKLEHIIFSGFTHEPALQLCERLRSILPPKLDKFFFSDNGSTAVEIAMKMAYQYWHSQKQDKRLFLSFDGGYHGDTFGAMSVGANSGFHNIFDKFFFKVLSIPFPETWDGDEDIETKEQQSFEILEQHLNEHSHEISSIILEPLVQGASGMRMCRPSFIFRLVERLRESNILVIFDEVMTGFGRTGSYFALDQIGCEPDFLCIAKGITGGFLPLALTITRQDIYNRFLNQDHKYIFTHSHSYTANPLACAAGLASLELLQNKKTQDSILAINRAHMKGIEYLKVHCKHLAYFRISGTISAFSTQTIIPEDLKTEFLNQGLLLRPIGNTIYILPPYVINPEEIESVYKKISSIINNFLGYNLNFSQS